MVETERRPSSRLIEILKVAMAALTPMVLVYLGFSLEAELARQEQVRAAEAEAADRLERQQQAVQTLSETIYGRRVRAELLSSALRRHSASPTELSLEEVVRRKRDYDEAYAEWGRRHQANLLTVRRILNTPDYTAFEQVLDMRLVGVVFRPLDACLTRAYDQAIRGEDARPTLEACDATTLIQAALDCGYALTDELYRLTDGNGDMAVSASIVDQRCPG